MSLMLDSEKPPRYTDRYHYTFFIVSGEAVVLFGNQYSVPRSEKAVYARCVWEVPRGNYYSVRKASAGVPLLMFFAKACRFGGGAKRNRAADARGGVDDALTHGP